MEQRTGAQAAPTIMTDREVLWSALQPILDAAGPVEIAGILKRAAATGLCSSPEGCPVANYAKVRTGWPRITFTGRRCIAFAPDGTELATVLASRPLRMFASQFDFGAHHELCQRKGGH